MKTCEEVWRNWRANLVNCRARRDLLRFVVRDLGTIEKVKKIEERAEVYLKTFLREWDPRDLLDEVCDMGNPDG